MTLFTDLMAACVLIGLCPDASQEITLPKDDAALLEYKKPDPIVPNRSD